VIILVITFITENVDIQMILLISVFTLMFLFTIILRPYKPTWRNGIKIFYDAI